jgi:hypothetical protein
MAVTRVTSKSAKKLMKERMGQQKEAAAAGEERFRLVLGSEA